MTRSLVRVFFSVVALALVAGCPHKERQEPIYDDGSVRNPGPEQPFDVDDVDRLSDLGDFEVEPAE